MNEMTKHTLCEACQKDCRECPMSTAAWLSLVVGLAMLGAQLVAAMLTTWVMREKSSLAKEKQSPNDECKALKSMMWNWLLCDEFNFRY